MRFQHLAVLLATAGIAAAVPVESDAALEPRLSLASLSCFKSGLLGLFQLEDLLVSKKCADLAQCVPPATKPVKLADLSGLLAAQFELLKCGACHCKDTGNPPPSECPTPDAPGCPPPSGSKYATTDGPGKDYATGGK